MKTPERFLDTNVLLYVLSADENKASRAEEELRTGGTVSVQVLNEFASVATRKLKMSVAEVREVLGTVRRLCTVVPLSEETHDLGLAIAERHGFSLYDSMIVAAALLAGCQTLVSEDMQDGQTVHGRQRFHNPFC
jgi:predicted nucleic acid-binding protein